MPYLKKEHLQVITSAMDRVRAQVYTPVAPLAMTAYLTTEPVPFARRLSGRKITLHEGDKWGENQFDCAWFHFWGALPAQYAHQDAVLLIDLGGEALAFDIQGEPIIGLTCVDSEFDFTLGRPGKYVCPFVPCSPDGTKVDFWADAGSNDLFGNLRCDGRVCTAQIAIRNERLFQLYYDLAVLTDLLGCLDEHSARYNQILYTLYDACRDDDINRLEEAAHHLLSQKGGDAPLHLTAIGHAHIDLAWKWPLRETRRKAMRTFATALAMMDRYPEYRFGISQPQLLAWLEEDCPSLFERVKLKMQEGRIELQGCMWVEADTNLTGGESLIRQILYGQRYWRETFGHEARSLWLPDVFGYSGALPQILQKSGIDLFMTQKLSWNTYNPFPLHTFRWRGIDGSEVFCHMLPEETYNSSILPHSVKKAELNYAQSGVCNEALILFGIGDGGGGPGAEHLESARRVRDLYGLCPVEQGFAEEALERMRQSSWHRVPVWQGELYLEKHQGTYTTSARSKRMNRRLEGALHDLEMLCAVQGIPCPEREAIWKEMLLYQFHDILPGSSIQRVYDESIARYEALISQTEALIESRTPGGKTGWLNTLSWPRSTIVRRGDDFFRVIIPAMGWTSEEGEPVDALHLRADPMLLENRFLRAAFDENGALISCFDKSNGRECLTAPSNVYQFYRDEHSNCWDIDIEYRHHTPKRFRLLEQSFAVEGAQAVCRQRYALGDSALAVSISLGEDDDLLRFDVQADWQADCGMLRTAFHTNVHTDRAAFDIQFGHIHRPNHDNTLVETAQFEACAHKWVSLDESSWGVALINDSKYGYRVKENIIDMNLLRAAHNPSHCTDRGEHSFSYALYPHTGSVQKVAEAFNAPLRPFQCASSFCFLEAQGIMVETLKPAEDGDGLILRAYEPNGTHAKARIQLAQAWCITPCDLMERAIAEKAQGDTIIVDTRPFEILTWRLRSPSN